MSEWVPCGNAVGAVPFFVESCSEEAVCALEEKGISADVTWCVFFPFVLFVWTIHRGYL